MIQRRFCVSNTVEYAAFVQAKQRCCNLQNPRYADYGGRGIKFLYSSFEEFIHDIGWKSSSTLSLDRINNDGNYEPGNCRWATPKVQGENRRSSKAKHFVPACFMFKHKEPRHGWNIIIMEKQLTQIELEHKLEITPMTLYLWRKGKKLPPLPHTLTPNGEVNSILFDYDAVEKWLQKYKPKLVKKLENVCECKRCERNRGAQVSIPPEPTRGNPIAQIV